MILGRGGLKSFEKMVVGSVSDKVGKGCEIGVIIVK
ncbi:universal stress protein [Staphylococcus epidermidis]|nr:universal stress protein [Staphylococcus epidermidis]